MSRESRSRSFPQPLSHPRKPPNRTLSSSVSRPSPSTQKETRVLRSHSRIRDGGGDEEKQVTRDEEKQVTRDAQRHRMEEELQIEGLGQDVCQELWQYYKTDNPTYLRFVENAALAIYSFDGLSTMVALALAKKAWKTFQSTDETLKVPLRDFGMFFVIMACFLSICYVIRACFL